VGPSAEARRRKPAGRRDPDGAGIAHRAARGPADFADCDVVVLCSVAVETLSIAALEAMALERPVVHSDIGGAAEMIRPGENGFLFPVGDTGALVERLAALAGEEARRRMGVAARATVEQRFSERAMVDRYETLLLDLESARRNRENLRTSAPAH
jgi:glycosyltransferase involved in cell wall biosynthesis